ncbi:MAG: aldo/keto reductase, partial [Candidatus Aminicenantes bacterium]|nr:aldo/keto reductase [Candidatus Aminicenantes bacterium]
MKRREFLKSCAASPVALKTLPGRGFFSEEKAAYDAKGLPTRVLGKTGVSVPLAGFGAGSRFCAVQDPGKSVEILNHALDHGFYYWDTAHDYGDGKVVSEERLGLVLRDRRKEVFLSTKTHARTYDGAMRDLEESLKRLKTDRLDIWKIHEVLSAEDAEKIGASGGVLDALHKAKDEKITRFIGFSGHSSAEAMTALAERHDFDTMLIALNHYEERKGDMERGAIPAAAAKGMGVNVIKVIRPREKGTGLDPADLIRYALSLPHVCAAVVGTDSVEVLKKNAATIKNFTVLDPEEMKRIRAGLSPFFEDWALPWMCPGYRDGTKV